jgi:hypothetical protein
MELAEIRGCLEGDGWPLENLSETTVRSRFRGKNHVFPLFIHTDELFVIFAVIPYIKGFEELDIAEPLLKRLLQLNREVNMARFSVDGDGDVILSVEYKLQDLDPSEVRDAVDVLSFYAEKHFDELSKLAEAARGR